MVLGVYDGHVLLQGVVYVAIFITGFVACIPVAMTTKDFRNECILYTDVEWKGGNFDFKKFAPVTLCEFCTATPAVVCIGCGLVLALYNLISVFKSKDPNVGISMWIMPVMLANALMALMMFIVACIISVGLKNTCDGFTGENRFSSCADVQKVTWKYYDGTSFYSNLKAAEAAAWIAFVLRLLEVGLSVVRFLLIRRQGASGAADLKKPQDFTPSASNPSA